MKLEDLKTRDDIGLVLNDLGLFGEGAEIGVEYGKNAEVILRTSRLDRLFLIDAWKYIPGHDPRGFGTGYDNWERVFDECKSRVARFEPRARILRMASIWASNHFADESLDFVYIDANHMSPWIDDDLKKWFPKVKPGGIIGGHDYLNRSEPAFQCDVQRVVDEFFGVLLMHVHVTQDDVPSWYVIKGA